MSIHLRVSGCGCYLALSDCHNCCLTLLWISCTHCGKITISVLWSRLDYLRLGGVPSPIPQTSSSYYQRNVPGRGSEECAREGLPWRAWDLGTRSGGLESLNTCLSDINSWFSSNFLHLNEGKTEVIVFEPLGASDCDLGDLGPYSQNLRLKVALNLLI